MTQQQADRLQNVYERQIDRLIAERIALLHDIVRLAQSVVEAIPPLSEVDPNR